MKVVIIDSALYNSSRVKRSQTQSSAPIAEKTASKHSTIEIEGVTDVLTKYRARLREKNIFQTSLTKPSPASGDAQLLQQVKKQLESVKSPSEDGLVTVEMDTILNYMNHRNIKVYVYFFNYAASFLDEGYSDRLTKELEKNHKPPLILDTMDFDETLDEVLDTLKIQPRELMVLSDFQHILTLSKTRDIITCRFG